MKHDLVRGYKKRKTINSRSYARDEYHACHTMQPQLATLRLFADVQAPYVQRICYPARKVPQIFIPFIETSI